MPSDASQLSSVSRKFVNVFTLCGLVALGMATPLTFANGEDLGKWEGKEVQVEYKVKGELKINPDAKKVRQQPVSITAKLDFVEATQPTEEEAADQLGVRYYKSATADLKIGENNFQNRLDAASRLLVAERKSGKLTFQGVDQPLKVYEMDLVALPADVATLSRLVPKGEITKRTAWKVEKDVLAPFLRLDAISASTCSGRVTEVDDAVMTVEIEGDVNGVIHGASTEIKMVATLIASLETREVESITLAFDEDRAISHAEPGFKVNATLVATIADAPLPLQLSNSAIEAAMKSAGGAPLVEFASADAGVRMLLDPRWTVMVNRHNLIVLRLVDKGDLLAQCNITPMTQLPSGHKVSIGEMEAQFKKSLGDKLTSISESTEAETSQGLKQLRLAAGGKEDKLNLHWIYHHLTNQDGQRVAVAFTLKEEFLERFGSADEALVHTLEILPKQANGPARQAEAAGEKESR